jgi:hypothetical protein
VQPKGAQELSERVPSYPRKLVGYPEFLDFSGFRVALASASG